MPRRVFSDWMFVMVHPSFRCAHAAHPLSIRKSAGIDETFDEQTLSRICRGSAREFLTS